MPGFMLHQGSVVLCSHAGQAKPTSVNPRVTINGQSIVTRTSIYSVAGCTLPPPPTGNGPCVTGQWITAATRVTTMGVPVLLLDSQSVCAPTGTPLVIIPTPGRVSAI